MKVLISYLKMKAKDILLFILIYISFIAVSFIFKTNTDAILILSIIYFLLLTIFSITGIFRHNKDHNALMEARKSISETLPPLPTTNSITDDDYQDFIDELFTEKHDALLDKKDFINSVDDFCYTRQLNTREAILEINKLVESKTINIVSLKEQLFRIEKDTETLLAFIKLKGETINLNISDYSLDDIVKESIRKYAEIFLKKKINLRYRELLFNVKADNEWLSFTIQHIIYNALTYTDKGSISIYLEDPCCLVIEDTGIGIGNDTVERIYKKKHSAAPALSLTICREILAMMNIKMEIKSSAEAGTAIKLFLTGEKCEVPKQENEISTEQSAQISDNSTNAVSLEEFA